MSIPDAGPAVEYSKAEATFDKSSSSENSGSESEEAVELKRAKEVRNLERVDGATETVPGARRALGPDCWRSWGPFNSEIRAGWGNVTG
jgi:hypothetical protein